MNSKKMYFLSQALGSDCSAQGSQGWCLITDVLGGGAGGVS